KLVTHFEDLSIELIYEILEYLDAYDIYQSFFNLNMHFQNYVISSTFPLKINISTLSKSQFHDYYIHFIELNKYHIRLLNLSNIFVIDFFFSAKEDISTYSQLQTLILLNIKPKSTQKIFNRLFSLPNLSSLTVHFDHNLDEINIFDLIFQLPILKYCKISFSENVRSSILPTSTNTFSSIEHLIIIKICDLNTLAAILLCVPRLRYLSIDCIQQPFNRRITDYSLVLKKLTSVSLTIRQTQFDDLESFIRKNLCQVQTLYISTTAYSHSSDAKRWEKLILSDMPYLRTFKLHISGSIVTVHTDRDQFFRLQGLSSPFWFQRPCFFTQTYKFTSSERYHVLVYSILTDKSSLEKNTCEQKTILDSVDHVIIEDPELTSDCSKYFPNANQLSLSLLCRARSKLFAIDNLQYIIPLKQITKLNISNEDLDLDNLVNMLFVMPNIDTLTYSSLTRVRDEDVSLEGSERFQLVSKQNKIKRFTIKCVYRLKAIKILINLCPLLEHITIGTFGLSFRPTVAFLMSKSRESDCRLSSLCFVRVHNVWFEKIKCMIGSEKKPDEYSIEHVDSNCYLWL
ncbi:unnamed protein product, partial [Rotaria sp. Silwood2]